MRNYRAIEYKIIVGEDFHVLPKLCDYCKA